MRIGGYLATAIGIAAAGGVASGGGGIPRRLASRRTFSRSSMKTASLAISRAARRKVWYWRTANPGTACCRVGARNRSSRSWRPVNQTKAISFISSPAHRLEPEAGPECRPVTRSHRTKLRSCNVGLRPVHPTNDSWLRLERATLLPRLPPCSPARHVPLTANQDM